MTQDPAAPTANPTTTAPGIAWIVGVGPPGGLGAALSRRFAAAGLLTVISGRTADRLQALAHQIETTGGRALAAAGDVTDPGFIAATLARIRSLGRLEVAVFNAGGNRWQPTLDMDNAFFEEVWRLCCFAGFVFGRDCARELLSHGGGTLLFTGASASLRGRPQFTAFAAAKAGLRMVSQSLARELGPRGLHVAHVIVDGLIDGERAREVAPTAAAEKGPDGMLQPEAIAETYYQLYRQPRSAWTQELDLRPHSESF